MTLDKDVLEQADALRGTRPAKVDEKALVLRRAAARLSLVVDELRRQQASLLEEAETLNRVADRLREIDADDARAAAAAGLEPL